MLASRPPPGPPLGTPAGCPFMARPPGGGCGSVEQRFVAVGEILPGGYVPVV